jgi:hypothetical protein
LLVALVAIGVSVWTSSSFVSAWGEWLPDGKKDSAQALLQLRHTITDVFGRLPAQAYAALAIVAATSIAGVVAWQAVREALRARYPRGWLVGVSTVTAFCFVSILLALAGRNGIVSKPLLSEIFEGMLWISGAAIVFTTIYLLWSGFAKRALTVPYAGGALVVSAAFGATWHIGAPGQSVGMLWPTVLFLMVVILAPWSLNRIRHV